MIDASWKILMQKKGSNLSSHLMTFFHVSWLISLNLKIQSKKGMIKGFVKKMGWKTISLTLIECLSTILSKHPLLNLIEIITAPGWKWSLCLKRERANPRQSGSKHCLGIPLQPLKEEVKSLISPPKKHDAKLDNPNFSKYLWRVYISGITTQSNTSPNFI